MRQNRKKRKYIHFYVSALLISSLLAMTGCQSSDGNKLDEQMEAVDPEKNVAAVEKNESSGDSESSEKIESSENAESNEEPESSEAPESNEETISIPVLENLGLDNRLLTERFYKSGMKVCLFFLAGGEVTESEELEAYFCEWEDEMEAFSTDLAAVSFMTEKQKASYIVAPEIFMERAELPTEDWQISFIEYGEDFFVRLSGAGDLDGDYFTLEQMTEEPDLFERYMCRADFYQYSAEELRILRNSVYAMHGAVFSSEDLKTYFGEKIWYDGRIPTAEFPEDILSDAERANLKLIKEIENDEGLMIDGVDWRAAYEERSAAPYLDELDRFEETGIHTDMRLAVDKGFYYAVPGEIRVPVTLSAAQIQALEEGEELEIGACGVAGEIMMLQKNPNSVPGVYNYLFYEKGKL